MKSKTVGKDIPCKCQSKENWSGNINIRQSIKQRKSREIKGALYIMTKESIHPMKI